MKNIYSTKQDCFNRIRYKSYSDIVLIMNILTWYRATLYYIMLILYTVFYVIIGDIISIFFPIQVYSADFSYYFSSTLLFICRLVGIRIHLKTESEQEDFDYELSKRALWISNHRSTFDGTLITAVLRVCGSKIIITGKKEITYYPLFGSMASHANTIFIKRHCDQTINDLQIRAADTVASGNSILLFPEGSALSPVMKVKTDDYVRSIGVVPFKNLLVPKVKGFEIIKEYGKFDLVGNVTIRYDNPCIPGVMHHTFTTIFKIFPKDIYLNIKFDQGSDLYQIFSEKDRELDEPINKSEYKTFDNYSCGSFLINIALLVSFLVSFYYFPLFRYIMLGIVMVISIRDVMNYRNF